MWVAVQVFNERDIVIETNALGIWTNWNDALEYIKNRHDFDRAIETRQVIDTNSLAAVPVWTWQTRPGIWETVTIVPLETSSMR